MPVVDCYAGRKYQEIQEETWGHLKAKPNTDVPGFFIFTNDVYGLIAVIDFEFDVHCSPWLYQDTNDLINSYSHKTDRGGVYRFDGRYKVYKNGKRRFIGKFRQLKISKIRKL